MKRSENDEAVRAEAPSWQSALLVCKACGKRSSGPRRVKTKAVASEVKRLMRASRPRARVVMTSCLGLCPKGAVAVAMVGAKPGGARIIAVDTLKTLQKLLPLLAGPPATAISPATATMTPPATAMADPSSRPLPGSLLPAIARTSVAGAASSTERPEPIRPLD